MVTESTLESILSAGVNESLVRFFFSSGVFEVGCGKGWPKEGNSTTMTFLLLALAGVIFLALAALSWVSVLENEKTAARRSVLAALVIPGLYVALALLPLPALIPWFALLATVLFGLAMLLPIKAPARFSRQRPTGRLDERTIMFSRAALKPESENFHRYYEEFPQHRKPDDHCRKLPGLMSPKSGKYETFSFAAAGASFETVDQLAALVEGEPADKQQPVDPMAATKFIKGWMKKLGAVSSGVTLLKAEHLYTIKGRGPKWGEPIESTHRFAIAFSVEMDHQQTGTAPEGPTLMESAEKYLHAGTIATQVAVFIRRLGWPAEAHIDANYKVVCPLVARDAGLGEIGRMGLLMTPELGPRVRLGVVTTDLPLNTDAPSHDPTVLHFCSICSKCAEVCPPGAIPKGGMQEIDGARRWQLDSEACFSYWCAMGTDCGQCLRVCPYSHPDTLLHNLVRKGLGHSGLFRHFALKMDDLLYGRRPAAMKPAAWLPRRR